MPTGGRILIKAYNRVIDGEDDDDIQEKLPPGRYLEIRIKDQGIGISQENIDRIFDPYFTTKRAGSGLGLATSYSIIHKHGGEIAVTSDPGHGSTFTVLIPASDKPLPRKEESSGELIMGHGRVLIMDDEPVIRNIAEATLDRLGYSVLAVDDGQKALDAYQAAMQDGNPFDVVILDITVPGGMGGVETMELLKAIDPNVKAIVSSGYATEDIMAVPERLGFRGVLTKPYNVQQLSAVLHSVING
jgi:CheY-like chemotaxis protein